jgi:7-cyano-7-deazaguanine synthase
MKALVILSGGQDSTTCLAIAIQKHGAQNVCAVTFDYGQRHAEEINSAVRIARMAGIIDRHEIIDAQNLLEGTSPLVNQAVQVTTYASPEALPGGLEKTFVPMRNSLFLVLAANRAVVHAQGEKVVELYTGVGQEDYGGYPDCRDYFIVGMEQTINASLDDPDLPHIEIVTPLMYLSKAQTVELSEGIPGCREMLAWSHTCYNGAVPPCGQCHACLLRQKGYDEAGVTDPLLRRIAGSVHA